MNDNKSIEEINRHNMGIFMPCEYHDYVLVEEYLKECTECQMWRLLTKPYACFYCGNKYTSLTLRNDHTVLEHHK